MKQKNALPRRFSLSVLSLVSLVATATWTQPVWSKVSVPAISAKREYSQNYLDAYSAQLLRKPIEKTYNPVTGAAQGMQDVVWGNVPAWPSHVDMQSVFRKITDERVLQHNDPNDNQKTFPRRPSWLYPDDGCFTRAEVMASRLEQMGLPKPTKIFVFGDLFVQTSNHPSGGIGWWFHVTVAYRYGNEVYVFDPSIEPLFPLTAAQWVSRMTTQPSNVQVSLCDRNAYSADSDCNAAQPLPWSQTVSHQNYYLDSEWMRVEHMNRDPYRELGDNPPWAK